MKENPETSAAAPKLSDWQRFRQVGRYHGIRALGAITLWGAAEAWASTSGLTIASLVAILNAIVAGTMLAGIFHEWGHFIGARASRSYSPIVRKPTNGFIFGFIFEKNSPSQFLSMSIGGPAGNWLLAVLVFLFIPLESWSSAMLLAVVTAHAISVSVFEVPIILRTLRGTDPRESLDIGLADGSQQRGRYIGYGVGALLWLVAI
ncbi:MAG TPA: hypothetical protein VJ998_12040 [Pseudomonadales bacterium]|nr:hypothetical protein [Pseudomonadales bacterium]